MPDVKAFVASTSNDLDKHREHVIQKLRDAGFQVEEPPEKWPADGHQTPVELSRQKAASCDLMVLLVAWRRGYVPPGEELSITQSEYTAALAAETEVMAFLVNPKTPWYPDHIERDDPGLDPWRKQLEESGVVGYFSNEPESVPIERALLGWFKRRLNTESELTTPASGIAHELDPPTAEFVGRENELTALLSMIEEETRAILIHGMAGVGKTVLANAVASELSNRFIGGQIVLNMKGVDETPLDPVDAIARVLNLVAPQLQPKHKDLEAIRKDYLSALHGKRVLLLIDNAADAEQVENLVPPPGCLIIVTSRQSFSLRGAPPPLELDVFTEPAAEELLTSITPRTSEVAREIARLCGYLPLALRLVGSAMVGRPDLKPQTFAKRLRDERRRRRDLEPVFHSIGLSHALLSRPARLALMKLAVFPGEFDSAAAAAVWELDEFETDDVISELLRFALLQCAEGSERYFLHDLVREFSSAGLELQVKEAARSCHATHFEQVLAAAEALYLGNTEQQREGIALFQSEQQNIEAGICWAMDNLEADRAATSLCCLYPETGMRVMSAASRGTDMRRLWNFCLVASRKLDDRRVTGVALRKLADFDSLPEDRISKRLQAVEIAREVGNELNESQALQNLAGDYIALGQPEEAAHCAEQSLEIARKLSDRRMEAYAVRALGSAYRSLGKPDLEFECFLRRRQIARELGDRHSEAVVLGYMVDSLKNRKQNSKAVDLRLQAADILHELGLHRNELDALENACDLLCSTGRGQEIIAISERLEGIAELEGLEDFKKRGAIQRGLGFLELREYGPAAVEFEKCVDLNQEPSNQAMFLRGVMVCFEEAGDENQLRATFEQLNAIEGSYSGKGASVAVQLILGYRALYRGDRVVDRLEELFSDESATRALSKDDVEALCGALDFARKHILKARAPVRAIALYERVSVIAREWITEADFSGLPNETAILYIEIGDVDRALALIEKNRERFRGGDTDFSVINAETNIAFLKLIAGRRDEAIIAMKTLIQRCICPGSNFEYLRGVNEANLGGALIDDPNTLGEAKTLCESGLTIIRKTDHRHQEPEVLRNLACIAIETGELEQAIDLCSSSIAIAVETDAGLQQAESWWTLGEAQLAAGNQALARDAFEKALDYLRTVGHSTAGTRAKILDELNNSNMNEVPL